MVKFADSVLISRVDNELVLLDKTKGIYFGLDEVGCRMVSLLIEHDDTDTVADLLSREYDAPKDRISSDLRHLMSDLLARGLIHVEA